VQSAGSAGVYVYDAVYGVAASASQHGGFFESNAASGFALGVFGVTNSPSGAGMRAESTVDPATNPSARILDATRPGDTEFKVQVDGNVYADGAFTGGGADYADMLPIIGQEAEYTPGDVLVIGTDGRLIKAFESYSTAVVGVYSTQPGFVGDPRGAQEEDEMEAEGVDNLIPVTLVGVAPVRVSAENGAIGCGDLLVTSSTAGHAMRTDSPAPGTILGKALGKLESGTGLINALVTLQ
jgi:hypothetical protein